VVHAFNKIVKDHEVSILVFPATEYKHAEKFGNYFANLKKSKSKR
jgi:hypothetical protein